MTARLFAAWALVAAMIAGAVVGVLGVLPFAVLPRGRRERYTMRSAAVWARFVVKTILRTRVRIEGSPDIPGGAGALLMCNHRSWLDPLLLIGWGRSNGLSKKSILYIPVIGVMGWLAGAVYFDRRSIGERARARREVRELIRAGHRIQLFPEGTRSRDGAIRQKVFLTLPRDAYDDGLPVLPCAVLHTERVLPVGSFAAHPGQEVVLRFGAPLQPQDYPDRKAFADAAWAVVVALAECPERGSNPHSP